MTTSTSLQAWRPVIRKTLYDRDRPLRGTVTWASPKKATIYYRGFRIELEIFNVYINGCPLINCSPNRLKSGDDVYFEAIATPFIESLFEYYAILAWVGEKPSLEEVSKQVQGPPPPSLKNYVDNKFVGKVLRFYLPDLALVRIRIGGRATVICVSLNEFENSKSQQSDTSRNRLITDVASYRGTFITFKLLSDASKPLGYRVLEVSKATEQEYKAFCDQTRSWSYK